jgi:M6 family metalloprotease-like protein
MNKLYTILLSVLILPGSIAVAQRSNCAAYPEPVVVTQPDGSTLNVYVKGNEMLSYYQTLDGYSVIQNPKHNGAYEYATLDEKGDMIASGIKAGTSFQKTAPAKGLTYNKKQITAAHNAFYAHEKPMRFTKAANGDFPSMGTKKLLVVLMQFKDDPAVYTQQSFVDMLTEEGYSGYGGTGSFKEFYAKNSFGQFDLDITVIGYYTSAKDRVEYGQKDAQGNQNSDYYQNVRELVAQAVDSAELTENIDFSQYDNNQDGELDGLVVFHSGFGAEQGKNGYIWSHRSSLWGSSQRIYDGVSISNYCINPSKRDFAGTTHVRVGVVTHEFGHILGLPDLYDTDQISEGAGNFCLMAGGPWMNSENTPCQMSAWSKAELGWLSPTVIDGKGEFTMKNSIDSNYAYRINTPDPMEYYLLENRQWKSWDKYIPARGLAIWHIDRNKADNYSLFGSNDVNTDTAMYGMGLKQADGLRHLERGTNRGDGGDLYPGTTANHAFTPVSKPAAVLHSKDVNGNPMNSNVFITNITLNPDSSVSFDLGGKAAAGFTPSSKNGCAPFNVSFNNQSVFASNYLWNFGNGETSTDESPQILYTAAGTYTVSLIVYDQGEAADTFETEIKVFPSPEASYALNRDGFNLSFTNTSTGADYYQWRFSNNVSSNAANPTITVEGPVTFYMIAYNMNGCTDTAFGQVWNTGINDPINNSIGLSAFPNPFSETTTLNFELNENTDVTIAVFNLLGEVVYTKQITKPGAGIHSFNLDKANLASQGVYLVKITSGNQSGLQRIMKK